MKKIIFITLALAITTAGFCQKKKKTNAKVISDTTTVATKQEATSTLELTEDQKSKIKEALKAIKVEKKKLDSDTTLSADAKKHQLKAFKKEQLQSLKSILTPEQLKEVESKFKKPKKKKEDNE